MFRFAASRLVRGSLPRAALRYMSAAPASESSGLSRNTILAAIGSVTLATVWIVKDEGLSSNKVSNGVKPAKKAEKKQATTPSFNNLAVNVHPDGKFTVQYENDEGTIRFTQTFEKSGKAIGEQEKTPIVKPPPVYNLPAEIEAKIQGLEASVATYEAKVAELQNAASERQAVDDAKAAAEAKAKQHFFHLAYFPIRGRAEAIRLLFIDNDIDFVDSRITDEFTALKPSLHFGQVPVLYDNGQQIPQSNAILRHVGRACNLFGKDLNEAARLDFVNDGVEDVRSAYLKVIYREWETKDAFVSGLPSLLAPLEKLVTGPYIVGESPQFADYSLYEVLDTLVVMSPTSLDGSPNLKAFHQRMASRPKIAAYVASSKRPAQINGNGKQ